jgi:hypothetical protein
VIDLTFEPTSVEYSSPPILISGEFVFEESLLVIADHWLAEDEQVVLLAIIDHLTERCYFFQFEFGGYDITIWNGDYSFYAFVVNPLTDQVLGEGYPIWDDLRNPNPITVEGEGILEMNMFIFDVSGDY